MIDRRILNLQYKTLLAHSDIYRTMAEIAAMPTDRVTTAINLILGDRTAQAEYAEARRAKPGCPAAFKVRG